MAWLQKLAALSAARGWTGWKAGQPRKEEKARRKMPRLECFGDSLVFP